MSIREDLKAYVDGELSPKRAAEIREALNSDPGLQREVEFLRDLSEAIQEVAVEPVVPWVVPELKRKTESHPQLAYADWAFDAQASQTRAPAPPSFASFASKRPIRKANWWTPLNLGVATIAVLMIFGGASLLFPMFQPAKSARVMREMQPATAPADSAMIPPASNAMPEEKAIGGAAPGREEFRRLESMKGGEAEGATASLPAPNPPQSPLALNRSRMVVQTAQIDVRVPDAKQALSDASGMAQGLGGFVESSGISGVQGGLPVATIQIRVPQASFAVAMQRLRDMGEILSETSSGEDVTAQYADVDARLKVLRQEEEQYRSILGATKKISEVLEVKDRLGQVRQEIESLDAQRRVLKDQAALSTITATFQQMVAVGKPSAPKNWLEEVWAASVNALSSVGVFLGKVGVFLFVFSPIWLPIALLIWWLVRRSGHSLR